MHLLVWFPGSPRGPFLQCVSLMKPPEGWNAISETFLSARGEPWLREASKKVGETAWTLPAWTHVCLPEHTRMHAHTCTPEQNLAQTEVRSLQLLLRLPLALHGPEPWKRNPGGSRRCGSAPRVSGWEVRVSCTRSAQSIVLPSACSRDTNHEHTLKQLGVPGVPHLLPIIHPETDGRRQRGRSLGITDPSSCWVSGFRKDSDLLQTSRVVDFLDFCHVMGSFLWAEKGKGMYLIP